MPAPLIHYWTNPGRVHPEPYIIACGRHSFIVTTVHRAEVTCAECLATMEMPDVIYLHHVRNPDPSPDFFELKLSRAYLTKYLDDNYKSLTFKAEVIKIFEALQ